MTEAGRFTVPTAHPSLPGHFPGRPVVPGVVLLDEALALLLARHPGRGLAGLPGVKFLAPVLPGQEIAVRGDAGAEGRLGFACSAGGRDVLRGVALLA